MSQENIESLHPEIPEGFEAITALLELARAFSPDFQLPTLAAEPPTGTTGASAEKRAVV